MNQSYAQPHTQPQSPYVVRAPLLAAYRDAEAVRAEAYDDARAIREQALAEAEQIRQTALADGAEQAAAMLQSATKLAERYRRTREAEMVELAFGIAYRLVMDLPRDERTAALVRTALAEHSEWSRLRLRAHSAVAPMLRAALANTGIDVRDDDSLQPDETVLLHHDGRTDLGPVQQFRALMNASGAAEIG